jgi:hypothetical protein
VALISGYLLLLSQIVFAVPLLVLPVQSGRIIGRYGKLHRDKPGRACRVGDASSTER